MKPTLKYDRWQFDNRRNVPVSAVTHISHGDYRSMQTYRHDATASVREIPAWTLDDTQIRRVVAARLARIISAPIPNTLEELTVLDDKVVALFEKVDSEESRKSAALARRAGGLAAYWVAVIYKTFRLGRNSVEVAADLGATPWGVRQTIWRLKWTAKQLEAGTYGRRRNVQDVHLRRTRSILRLYAKGSGFCDIGRRYQITGHHLRKVLKNAGVWISRREFRFLEDEKEIVRLYQQGARLCDLRLQFNRTGHNIRKALKRAEVWKISPHGARCKAARERAKLRCQEAA